MEIEQADVKPHANLKLGLLVLGVIVVIATFALLIHKPSPAIDPTGSAINKSEMIKNEKFLSGSVLSVTPAVGNSTGVINMRANILDVNTKEDFIERSNRIFIEQDFSVKFDPNTLFEEKAVSDLVPGDIVQIYTDESIYLAKKLVAERVVFYDEQVVARKQIIGDVHMLSGVVQSATGTELVVDAEIVDITELDKMDLSGSYLVPRVTKDFKVVISSETKILIDGDEVSGADLSIGDKVLVTSAEDIYQENVLPAVQILVLPEEEDEFNSVSQ